MHVIQCEKNGLIEIEFVAKQGDFLKPTSIGCAIGLLVL